MDPDLMLMIHVSTMTSLFRQQGYS